MTGYSRHWDCVLCLEDQETVDYPRVMVCDQCIEPLAAKLCREEMAPVKQSDGVDIWDHPAINQTHFRDRARSICALLLRRRRPRTQRTG
jgi:hypothetical protein